MKRFFYGFFFVMTITLGVGGAFICPIGFIANESILQGFIGAGMLLVSAICAGGVAYCGDSH